MAPTWASCLFLVSSFFFFFDLQLVFSDCNVGIKLFNNFYDDLFPKSIESLKVWRNNYILQRVQARKLECDFSYPGHSYVRYSNYSESFFNAITHGDGNGSNATFNLVQSEIGSYSHLEAESDDRCNAALQGINALLNHQSIAFTDGRVATPVMSCANRRVSSPLLQ